MGPCTLHISHDSSVNSMYDNFSHMNGSFLFVDSHVTEIFGNTTNVCHVGGRHSPSVPWHTKV